MRPSRWRASSPSCARSPAVRLSRSGRTTRVVSVGGSPKSHSGPEDPGRDHLRDLRNAYDQADGLGDDTEHRHSGRDLRLDAPRIAVRKLGPSWFLSALGRPSFRLQTVAPGEFRPEASEAPA